MMFLIELIKSLSHSQNLSLTAGISTAYSPSFYAEAPADADVEDEEEEIEEEETDDEVRGSGAGDPSSNTEQFARVARKQT